VLSEHRPELEQPGASDHKLLARIVARVDPADVASEMVAKFRAEIASYQRLPESVLTGQIFEVSLRNVELFFRSVTDGVEPSEEELVALRASARNRASEGMPLEDLLHAYRVGGRLGWRALLLAAEGPEEQRALLGAAELLMRYVDQVSAAVAQTYLHERQHLVSEEERLLRGLLEALLRDQPASTEMRAAASRIGFPIERRYRAFVTTLAGAPAHSHAGTAAALRARGVLALTEGDRVAGLAPPSASSDLIAEPRLLFGLAPPAPCDELADLLDELRVLVELGRRKGMTGEIAPEAFLTELLLARSPRLARLARQRVLGPLENHRDSRSADLVATLATFVECELDRRGAAARLHVHPNTLDYRLRRISDLTGLELGRPEDITTVTLALKQRALDPDGDLAHPDAA
jgi:hypothetical protein